ncbi:MAG: hypothetical protein U0U67_14860 [Chitinophagales bacterium]
MNTNRFIPKFLQKLDDYLLKNKPAIWSSRIHLVLFFTSVISIAFFALLLFINSDPRQASTEGTWVVLLAIIVIISIVVFIYFLLRFNVLKRFGEWNSKDSLLSFIFYFISFAAIYFWFLLPSVTESIQSNRKYTFNELSNDQNQYNKAIALIEKDSMDFSVNLIDTVILITDSSKYSTIRKEDGYAEYITYEDNTNYPETEVAEAVEVAAENANNSQVDRKISRLDSASYYQQLKSSDSVVVLNDTSFLKYNIPTFEFCNKFSERRYSYSLFGGQRQYPETWTDLRMYHELIIELKKYDLKKYTQTINRLQQKYLLEIDKADAVSDYRQYLRDQNNRRDYDEFLLEKYFCRDFDNRMDNISDRMNQWNEDNTLYKLHVWYYAILASTILLWLFRHNIKKSFFLSFLIGALLFLATTILFILIRVDEFDVLDTVFVYFIIFCFFSVSIIKLKTQKIFPAIATNFIVIVTSFIPLYFVMYWYFLKIEQENNKFMYNHDQLRERMWHYAQRAEYIGFFLLLFGIYFLYSKLYKKWIALPEE